MRNGREGVFKLKLRILMMPALSSWISTLSSNFMTGKSMFYQKARTNVSNTPCLVLAAACLTSPALAGRQSASNTDANAIVLQMVATYQRATTIQETSAANFSDNNGTKLSQTYTIKYQKPNKLVII